MKGIILIATGHMNYGKMAYNLALTIKAAGEASIALVYDEAGIKSLRPAERERFDYLIPLPEGYGSGVRAKLHLDQLTPFDETIYLDADMLYISQYPVSELFKQFEEDFWMITEGSTDAFNPAYYFWASEQEIMKRYNVQWIPQTRSEVIYFKKGTEVFQKARSAKPERKLLSIREFAGVVPDELYFNIALAQLDIRPRAYTPAYWPRLVNKGYPEIRDLRKDYFLLSFGSNFIPSVMKKQHDKFMTAVCYRLGIPFLYKIQSKKQWAPGRLKM